MSKKTIIITRAVPGSGKTTITNCIVSELKKNSITVAIHSTDEYFIVKEKYIFEIDKLGNYHEKNLNRFKKSIDSNIDVIICDNTNIAPWQTEPYTKLARENNYQIIYITLDPRELIRHVESQKVTLEKPDAHGVEENILKNMIKEYYIYDDLLNPYIVISEHKHAHYIWDSKKNKKIIIGTAKHFDSDYIIRILPDEYQDIQQTIGNKIRNLIEETT